MIKTLKLNFLLMPFLFVYGCASNDDCTKIITIPEAIFTTPIGTSTRPAYNMEVACDFEIEPISENNVELKNFSYEIINFKYTPDTGKNTSRLQYEIKLNNNSDANVVGIPVITMDVDGTVSSGNFTSGSTSPCYGINANSSCILTFDKQESLDFGLFKSIKIVTVKYILTK
ncbi:hypothetical protein LNQ49_06270 [Flavobacterium sp. F-65]|uniref:CUB domain-containing protein n=1 Tax=Flavobacterium pisciphilum TaxID=2893755 RepID=A0ABS8MR12_9FLAO|nr:hypothetical protein [Flavobacterium sp. F-65]MCC9071197.1 hypothetical protein [Flavobacterium sp. F-65]